MRSDLHDSERSCRDALEHLDAWEALGLITPAEAESVRGYEREQRTAVSLRPSVETAEEEARPAMSDLGHRATR